MAKRTRRETALAERVARYGYLLHRRGKEYYLTRMHDDVDGHFADDDGGVGYADIESLEWVVTHMMEVEGELLQPETLH